MVGSTGVNKEKSPIPKSLPLRGRDFDSY